MNDGSHSTPTLGTRNRLTWREYEARAEAAWRDIDKALAESDAAIREADAALAEAEAAIDAAETAVRVAESALATLRAPRELVFS